jgi:sn-glycerol 3-phosphate transport system substrate-binding protein
VPELAQAGAFLGGDREPLVSVPFNRSTPIMLANRDALAKHGVAIPKTWDELRAAAARFVRAGSEFGFEVPISWWFWVAMVGQAGGAVVAPDGSATLGDDAGVKALRFWQDLVHRDRTMRPPPGRDYNAWQATNQDFLSGRVPLIWTSTAFLRYLEETARFPVQAAPLPHDVRGAVPTGGTFFVILKGAPEPEKEAAWAFLRFMCDAEQTIDWATRTGYLPVTTRAIQTLRDRGFYAKHPNDEVALAQLPDVQPWPWSPGLFRIQREVVEPRLEDAVLLDRDPRAVLDEARVAARET